MDNTNSIATNEFQQVRGIISLHRSRALQTVNNENLLAAWEVGAFVSASNHFEIFNACTTIFYVLYSHKERLYRLEEFTHL